jgi:hypothetical protein
MSFELKKNSFANRKNTMIYAIVSGLIFTLTFSIASNSFFTAAFAADNNANDQQPSFLKVIVRVDNTGGGTAVPNDFHIFVYGNNPSPASFDGSESGTIVTLGVGNYSVETSHSSNGITYGVIYSGDCSPNKGEFASLGYGGGSIREGDKKTCTLTEIYPNFNNTTSSLPIKKNETSINNLTSQAPTINQNNLTSVKTTTPSTSPTQITNSAVITNESFSAKGVISSLVEITPSKLFLLYGNWSMHVLKGRLTDFKANTTSIANDGTGLHSHQFMNFVAKNNSQGINGNINSTSSVAEPTSSSFSNSSSITATFQGTLDVGTNNIIKWHNVNSTITVEKGKVIIIKVDDAATNHHFANQPIYGIVRSIEKCQDEPVSNMQFAIVCENNS